jgi:AraC-like DNA-binding protein
MSPTALASSVHIYRKLLDIYGLDANRFLREMGVGTEFPADPSTRVPIQTLDELLVQATSHIPDEAWGLKAAHCWHPGNLGVLGHALLASSTLRTALTRVSRYWRILGERATVQVEDTDRGFRFTYALTAADPVVEQVLPDCVLAITLDMCRTNAGEVITPLRVTLCRKRPADPEPWISFFGCAVEFGAAVNGFTLSAGVTDRPLPAANRPLAGVLDKLLAEQLAELSTDDVVSRAKAVFLEQLSSGEPSGTDIAQRLNMSRRTLQRKLAEAETSYQQLIDDTRREMALRYIDDRKMSVTDITFLLGFSGQSAFARAFKRWTGSSPTDYRNRSTASAQS